MSRIHYALRNATIATILLFLVVQAVSVLLILEPSFGLASLVLFAVIGVISSIVELFRSNL